MTEGTNQSVNEQSAQAQTTETTTEVNLIDSLAPDLREEASLKTFKDVNSLAKSYVNAQRMIGNSLRIPSADASDEARAEFYKKLESVENVVKIPDPNNKDDVNRFMERMGRPKDPNEYKINLPQEINGDHPAIQGFKNLAHNLGLNNAQADALVQYELSIEQKTANEYKALADSATNTLKSHWGNEFGNKINDVKDVVSHYATKYPEMANSLINSKEANNPVFLMMAADLAKSYKESGVISGKGKIQHGLTPDEARARIGEIRGNVKDPLFDSTHPDHDARVEYMSKLYSIANPQ